MSRLERLAGAPTGPRARGRLPDEDIPSIYRPSAWKDARAIQLNGFRQIMMWPLVLRLPRGDGRLSDRLEGAVCELVARLKSSGSPWTEVDDLLDHLLPVPNRDAVERAEHRAQSYGEFVYFHDYIQPILFRGPAKDKDKAVFDITLFRRTDVRGAEIRVDGRNYYADILRCNLYLFQTGAATLAVEFDFAKPLTLAEVQTVMDRLRRCYPPYFAYDKKAARHEPGRVPERVRWLDVGGKWTGAWLDGKARWLDAAGKWREPGDSETPETSLDYYLPEASGGKDAPKANTAAEPDSPAPEADAGKNLSKGFVRAEDGAGFRTAPVFAHWRALLHPLEMAGYETAAPALRHVVDERIPCMSYISLSGAGHAAKEGPTSDQQARNDLYAVSRGDWIRLCFADGPGSYPLPYSPVFLQGFETENCYDRYFPSETTYTTVRYMFAGYHFSAVGAGNFFDTTISEHFRRHYFQMALLTQIEFVSLLAISARISDAVREFRVNRSNKAKESNARAVFKNDILDLQRDFLEFVHVFRFTSVSNQLQAGEMFDAWRQSLNLPRLYEDVRLELEAATNFVLGIDNKEQAEAANWLGFVATIGLVAALILGVLGINVFLDGKSVENLTEKFGYAPHFVVFGLITLLVSLGGRAVLGYGSRYAQDEIVESARRVLNGFMVCGGLLIVIGCLWWVSSYALSS